MDKLIKECFADIVNNYNGQERAIVVEMIDVLESTDEDSDIVRLIKERLGLEQDKGLVSRVIRKATAEATDLQQKYLIAEELEG